MSATIDTTERHQVDKVCTLCGRQGDHAAANCPLARACGQRNGIRTLQDIIDRCFLDEDTGCWIWRQAVDKRQGRRGQIPVAYFAAGVVGEKKFAYDVWGDTVNLASRMESSGAPGRVNVTGSVMRHVEAYVIAEARGRITIKGKGEVESWFIDRLRPEYSADEQGRTANDRLMELREKARTT